MDKVLVSDLLGRIQRTRFHVVLEAKRVSNLMCEHVLQQPAHYLIRYRKLLDSRIQVADLEEIPGLSQVHYVVIELDVRIEDLARTRIADVRAGGIFRR